MEEEGGKDSERPTERLTDTLRQRQTVRPKLTGRGQTNTPIGREIGGQTDGQTERQTERKAQPKVILKLICIEFVVFFQ